MNNDILLLGPEYYKTRDVGLLQSVNQRYIMYYNLN